jgi:hypothetical protein
MMSRIDSWHRKISTGRHFQNGCHNTARWTVEIFQCRESNRDIIIYPHFKFWWYRTMLNFYRPYFMPCFGNHFENDWFPTLNNVYLSPLSKLTPQYRTNSTLFDFNAISYVGRLWCPELIPDIEKFLLAAIFFNVRNQFGTS